MYSLETKRINDWLKTNDMLNILLLSIIDLINISCLVSEFILKILMYDLSKLTN
mgnify:CR=1 FL=1